MTNKHKNVCGNCLHSAASVRNRDSKTGVYHVEFPAELRSKINELAEKEELNALKASAARLSEGYRSESTDGKRGAVSKTDVLAYAATRMSATFAAVSRALELSFKCFDGEIASILDVGAGTGAGTIAAAFLTGCDDIVCIEREADMLKLGRELCEHIGVHADWKKRDISLGIDRKADLVLCSYCLNELPEARRTAAITQLAGAAEKLLVIVEPGTPYSFAEMKQTRQALLNKGLKLAAPCPHENECSLPSDDWCHFTARAQRSKLHKLLKNADVPYEDEKFCFLAAAKTDCSPCAGRILRKPHIASRMITLSLCCADGIKSKTVTKNSPLFKAARKSECGGEFPLERNIL